MRRAEIKESSRELKAKERVGIMQSGTSAIKLDSATNKGDVVFKPSGWAVIHVQPDTGEEFDQYVIIGDDGSIYQTGSEAFWSAFRLIWDEMTGEEEDYQVRVFRVPSKKYEGKTFITCSIQ